MTPETEAAIRAHAIAEYPRECCGLILIEQHSECYLPCRNAAPPDRKGRDGRLNHFRISKPDYAAAMQRGEVIAIVHSHPDVPALPTQADRRGCEESGLTWHIVRVDGTEGEIATHELETVSPCGYKVPLIGRPFYHGVLDCYALVRDWFEQERGIELLDFEREDGWWEGDAGEDLYMQHFREAGFVPVDAADLQVGDCFIMQVRAKRANHAAVYLGDGVILHHLYGRPSRRDVYGGYWADMTRLVVRYRGKKAIT